MRRRNEKSSRDLRSRAQRSHGWVGRGLESGRVGVFFILLFILNVPVDRGDEEEVREARALRTRCVDAEAMGGSEAKRMGRRYWSYGEKRLRRFRGVMGSKYSNSE